MQQRRVYRFQTRLPETVLECARATGAALADVSVLAGDDYGLYAVAFAATGDTVTLDALEADWGLVPMSVSVVVPAAVPMPSPSPSPSPEARR